MEVGLCHLVSEIRAHLFDGSQEKKDETRNKRVHIISNAIFVISLSSLETIGLTRES
jgi:hypothetical protein